MVLDISKLPWRLFVRLQTLYLFGQVLGFKKECEDKYTSDQYIHGTIYSVLPLTYKILLETLCMSDS